MKTNLLLALLVAFTAGCGAEHLRFVPTATLATCNVGCFGGVVTDYQCSINGPDAVTFAVGAACPCSSNHCTVERN